MVSLQRPFISRVMLAFVCFLTLTVATPAATRPVFATPRATGDYGSIAYSPSLQQHFFFFEDNKVLADDRAWNSCVQAGKQAGSQYKNDCNSAVWVHNGWISIALGDNGAWGTGYGTSADSAKRHAKQVCEQYGGTNCQASDKDTKSTSLNPKKSTKGGIGFGTRRHLFVLLQGINSSLTQDQVDRNDGDGYSPAFYDTVLNIRGIVPMLQQNGYDNARFLVYSYRGPQPNTNGGPKPYNCLYTFNPLIAAIHALSAQIQDALATNPNADVYLIGHSLGGIVALGYEIALLKTSGIVSLPQGATLKGVVTLDSPLGGVESSNEYTQFIDLLYQSTCKGLTVSDMHSILELFNLYDTAKAGGWRGETADILRAILHRGSEDNQHVAFDGASQGKAFLTVGNPYDIVYSPNVCNKQFNLHLHSFADTQWLNDQAPNAAVYGRFFAVGDFDCTNGLLNNAYHFEVLNDNAVEKALTQFFPNGGVPSALHAAKHT